MLMVETADEELAGQARDGDRAAYDRLYRRFADAIWSLARRMTLDDHQAHDLTQEIFARALSALRTYDPSRKFSSWLFKLATNRIIDHLKERSRWKDLPDEELAAPGEPVLPHEDVQRIRAALGRVPEPLRIVLILYFQESLAYPEIAQTLDITVNHARVRLFRGLRKLREEMKR